ncbi:MAG: alginate lyase family protein, partial [Acidobacteriota bacterium]|nr:alginate lyase family protein [Acidobacteriota bacterium]
AAYLEWLTMSRNGVEERDTKNNHATCWNMQAAAFARLTENREVLKFVADRFRTILVPHQIEPDGRQPEELRRTKPYGYCLFNLEAFTTLCRIVSEAGDDLWRFSTPDGRGVEKAIEFLYPYMRDKKSWPHAPDVMYFQYWPMRQESLLFGGLAYGKPAYLDLWKTLPADSDVDEVIRNYFIRQPVLWVS